MPDLLPGIPGQSQQTPGGTLQLPRIQLPQAPAPDVSFQGIYNLLSQRQPQMTQDVLPYIAQTLQAPVVSLQESGAQAVAAAQSEAMKRGMTGSDIEAAGMAGARATTAQQIADAHATVSQQLAQYVMQTYGMDIAANREMFNNLAQAIGQKLASDREYQMFMQQMSQMDAESRRMAEAQIIGSVLGGVGMIGGGALAGRGR